MQEIMTSHPTSPLYLEDLSVGDLFTSGKYRVSVDEIKSFARQYDPQPFHLDEEAAKDTLFAGLAASGWHSAAITMKLLIGCLPIANGLIGAGMEISWPIPTRPDDEVHVEVRIIAIKPSRSKPDMGIVTMQFDTLNQRGELVQKTEAKMVVFRCKPA
jgi:acyl dehydratase